MTELSSLALLQADEDFRSLLIWLAILVLPLIGRALRWLLGKLGMSAERAAEEARRRDMPPSAAEARAAREELARRQADGEDMWRRMLEGELMNPPPVVAPVEPPPQPRFETRSPEVTVDVEGPAEDTAEPVPLSVLGEVLEPGEAPEASLETVGEPQALATLESGLDPVAAGEAGVARRRARLGTADLRRAVWLSEVLAPPLALRGARREHA